MDCILNNQIPISSEEVRNWAELPHDVLSHIFLKLGAIDILLSAQSVCPTWRKVSKEPSLFRSIDMRNRPDLVNGKTYDLKKLAREAVDRSCGQLVEFSMDGFGNNELLAYIADKSCELRCLRLVSSYEVRGDALMNMAKKAFMLEELEICHCSLSEDTLIAVGNACPQLKSLRLNRPGYRRPHIECDNEALAIAGNMLELRHLQLFGNKLTNMGLKAILDGCLHLESLDLRQCFNVNLEGDLLKFCRDRLIKIRFPNDSSDDCEFDDENEVGSSEEGYYDSDYFYDFDFGYDYSSEEIRNWLELPSDVIFHIFLKLGAIDIFQSVCSMWRKVSKEPLLFRSIDMRNRSDLLDDSMYNVEKMAREAVDRSCGQLVEFSMDNFGSDELLAHIADMSGELRCLGLYLAIKLAVKHFCHGQESCHAGRT
ncbi:hypothetical protein MKW92_002984 [Papaver armeniacum]|nr:hypothetical protein MKW92_002984 [Papaver armeniacum]